MSAEPHMHIDRPPYATYILKYALIAIYGLGSGIVGITTLDVVAGRFWGLLWPGLITVLALLAMVGVIRSRLTEKEGMELIFTLLLLALFAGYVVAIVVRSHLDGNVQRLPTALLPVILSVFPGRRLVQIARKSR